MSKPNKLSAYFSIKGIFDPAAITSRLGMLPSDCWAKGDLNPLNQIERKFSRWRLGSRLDHSRALEEHIRDVISQLQPNVESVREISKEFNGVLEVVGYFYSDDPGPILNSDEVAEIAALGLSMDFDYYYLHSARPEDTE